MSVHSHPGDETLLRHAAGTLPAGPRLLVETHLQGCPACRITLRRFEAVGGALLEAAEPVALASDALARTLARLGPAPTTTGLRAGGARPDHLEAGFAGVATARRGPEGLWLPDGVRLPRPLAARRIGALMPVAPGVRVGRVHVPEDAQSSVFLFQIGPGRAIPRHTHAGTEYTHVICGGFSDPSGHYGPGDLVEADADVDHSPRVDDEGTCVCLAAFEGRPRFHGLLGVVLRPFL
ncbi:cupin domain-containing protein [Xanthobacter autotrophicus]|uniref:cupin domain-containing protein n=1 Tax=Xanthobacter TaxID=279 RepID=UPI0024ABB86D|nr:cupin domain-containing protein [Xanthobacter autotrophicus]MDI4664973.1 cupin domain-containing protein [Xanthobacter autotrophicus]